MTPERDGNLYRLSLALLWAGVAMFATLATVDALLNFTGNLQGLFIGATTACFVSAFLQMWFKKLNETVMGNRGKSEQLQEDVDQLRRQMNEVKALAKAIATRKASEQDTEPVEDNERPLAIVRTLHLRSVRGRDAIAGSRTYEPVDEDSIWAVLDENDTRTLPGRHTAS